MNKELWNSDPKTNRRTWKTEKSPLESRPWGLDFIHLTLDPHLTKFNITVIKSSVGICSLDVLLKDVAHNELIGNQKPCFLLHKLHSLGMALGCPLGRSPAKTLQILLPN
jgi:hypothetical protein